MTTLPASPVTTTSAPMSSGVAGLVHCGRFALTATLVQQDARVSAVAPAATRQLRRTEHTRLTGSGSAFRHNDTWTRNRMPNTARPTAHRCGSPTGSVGPGWFVTVSLFPVLPFVSPGA